MLDLKIERWLLMAEKHIRQILSELCTAQYIATEEELYISNDNEDEARKEAERKAKRMKLITCIYCGSVKKSTLDSCEVCEAKHQMELGEYM